jgi:hypothetical protein
MLQVRRWGFLDRNLSYQTIENLHQQQNTSGQQFLHTSWTRGL